MDENKHIPKDAEGYITPNHYYGQNYQLLDVIEDQLSPEGVRGCTKAKYYLDELIIYCENHGEKIPEDNNLKPKYYNKGKIEVIDILEDQLSKEELKGFYLGMVIRYLTRERKKNGLEDLLKAKYYLDRFITNLEGGL